MMMAAAKGSSTIHQVTLSSKDPDSWWQSGVCLARIKEDG